MKNLKIKKHGWGAFLASVGFILSPLTWWNDMVINLPLAFGFAFVVGKILSFFIPVNLVLFLTLTAIGYFLTNVLGFMMMRSGAARLCQPEKNPTFSLKKDFAYSVIALILVVLSIQVGLLDLGETEKLMSSVLKVAYLN